MKKQHKAVLRGLLAYLPFIRHQEPKHSSSARYCYTVWMRHLVMAHKNNLPSNPEIVAELGPGASIGTGIAALISGAEKYYAFDVEKYASIEKNIVVFDEMVELFRQKSDLPGEEEFSKIKPYLDNYKFPCHILTSQRLEKSLDKERLEKIKYSILNPEAEDSVIKYFAPWESPDLIQENTVDMIFSQAVLEHVDALHSIYKTQFSWLKPGGFISHRIDLKCHGTHEEWDGHRTFSDLMWKVMRGKRSYSLNREPCSRHIFLINESGLRLVVDKKDYVESCLDKKYYSKRFKDLSGDDMMISGVFLQAQK